MRPARAILTFLLVLPLAAQQPVPLRNGQSVTVQGMLGMEQEGRLQFVTVKTGIAYLPMVIGEDHKQHPTVTVHEIGLSGYHRYELLYGHRGQAVTVTGKMMTDSASPYYFHATSLSAKSIRLADGTELIGTPRANDRLAVDVGDYRASVVLRADAALPWQYSAQGEPDLEHRFLSCSSNGGGDVVNCNCAVGFRPMHAESSVAGVTARLLNDMSVAQFGPVDRGDRVELSVACSR